MSDLPTLDSPDGLPVGASLGGVQAKVLLTRTKDGWAWPAFGAMSTHLIKPAPQNGSGPPGLLEAEWWSGALARHVGLRAAASELKQFGERTSLVVERYDRHDGGRFHQEDFTQALSLRPSDKYELGTTTPGRLQRIAALAGPLSDDESAFLLDLLRAVAFNAIIGNSDAHSKNYSLLISSSGSVSLAPLYDVAPVMLMDSNYRFAGHAVDGQTRLAFVTRDHLVREAVRWGVSAIEAGDTITSLATAVADWAESISTLRELGDTPSRVAMRARIFAA
ncbi:type II toxin-antitoxin system HipA family toxin [Frondihabitans cladoniiphilus]|uniref:type II toxin-antitoxin system HipA family toxin n=1 Tax=Frondihabitans cladoniiphilus TaxID=715785 RepID=UPI0031EB5F55